MNHKESGIFRGDPVMVSKLKFYSIGLVAENKKLGSTEIEATPIEELTMLDGEISAASQDYKGAATDSLGRNYESSVKTQVTISARWLRFGDANRMTAPDVRRGESVMLFQFGDADKYYWMTLKQDSHLRKLETVVWAISATQNESSQTDADNSYYLEISSHTKVVHFHTSKADGEPFAYDIQINAKTGSILITDDVGNFISLDSSENRLELKNADGSHIDLNKENLAMIVPKNINISTQNFSLSSTNVKIESSSTTVSGSNSIRIVSPSTSIN